MKNILVLDTGKEWGGGTNSLLALLHRIDKEDYKFAAVFYHNCKKTGESDIRSEMNKAGADFILLEQSGRSLMEKVLRETGRILLFFNRRIRRNFIFFINYLFRIRKNADKIAGLIKKLDIDLLYMNNQPSSNFEGILAAKNTDIPSLLHSRIETDLNIFEVRAVNKWLTRMICVSHGLRTSFIHQGINESKCAVVYNGIDIAMSPSLSPVDIRRELEIHDDEILIGSVGSLVRRKRFYDLIEAIAYLVNEKGINGIKCIIAGEGPEKDSLQKIITRNKLNDGVKLIGFKADVISYINAMDIFILPSEKEGCPRVVLEAMLMGKPVIGCDIAGPSELIINGETGFLIKVGDQQMLSNSILNLISSESDRRTFGKTGRKRVIDNYSMDLYINGVSHAIQEVLE
jgi:glycosyltransferase involved in cell wall biosynthesis